MINSLKTCNLTKWLNRRHPLLLAAFCSALLIIYQSAVQNGLHIFSHWFRFVTPLVFILNFIPVFLFFVLIYLISNKISVSFWASGIILSTALVIDNLKVYFRDEPLKFSDIILIKEASNIMENYQVSVSPLLAISVILFILAAIYITISLNPVKFKPSFRIIGIASCALLLCLSYLFVLQNEHLSGFINKSANEYYEVDVSRNKGIVYYILSGKASQIYLPPEGYSDEYAKNLLKQYTTDDTRKFTKPNVIAIMSESFCDLSDAATNLEFIDNEDPIKNYNRLTSQGVYGKMMVPGFAGATASTEFEFLSGSNVSLIDNSMPDIYKAYATQNMYSIARTFKDLGYKALAIHPGHKWFYNRQNVYKYMGFDNFITKEDLPDNSETINYYISDKVTSKLIIDEYEKHLKQNPNEGYFNFTVTIQNHGPYMNYQTDRAPILKRSQNIEDALYNTMNNYFLGLRDADCLLGDVSDYLEKLETPTVLVFFGDHLPYIDAEQIGYKKIGYTIDTSVRQGLINKHSTPYLIWGNKAARESMELTSYQNPLISANLLSSELFNYIGLKSSPYINFVSSVKETVPVIVGGNALTEQSITEEQKQKLKDYSILQYYTMRKMY